MRIKVQPKYVWDNYGDGDVKRREPGYEVYVDGKEIGEVWKGLDKKWHNSLYSPGSGYRFNSKKEAVEDLVAGGTGSGKRNAMFGPLVRLAATLPKGSEDRKVALRMAGRMNIDKTASQSKLRKNLDGYGKELMEADQIMGSALKDLQAARKSMHGLGMNMRRLAATPFGDDPQDFKYLYQEVVEQLSLVQRMLMSYRYVERVHVMGDEYDVAGTLGVADGFDDQEDMERYWGTDYDTSKSFRAAASSSALTRRQLQATLRLASSLPKGSEERKIILRLAGRMKARMMQAWEALLEMVPSLPMELGDSYAESTAIADVMKAYPREFTQQELYDVLDYMRRQPAHMRKRYAANWVGDAIKRPGRLHKYFGIPEDEKIPMAKIDGEIKKLKDKEDKSKEEDSLLDALYLGKRLKKMGSDRKQLIRLASSLPKGSEERRAILAGIQNASARTASKKTTLSAELKLKDGTVYVKGSRAEVFFSERNPSMSEVEIEGRKIKLRTVSLHKYLRGFPKPPSMRSLQKMDSAASGPTVTGVRNVEMDGYGPDGSPSWMLAMGLI